jgi:hypothetical protein
MPRARAGGEAFEIARHDGSEPRPRATKSLHCPRVSGGSGLFSGH